MASSVSMTCVGCGVDLTGRAKTRKKLGEDSKASDQATREAVLSLWRELAAVNNLQSFSKLESSLLKMCCSCFNDYSKLGRLKSSILSKLEKAREQLKSVEEEDMSAPPPSKRARITTVSEPAAETCTQRSPSVMVNNIPMQHNELNSLFQCDKFRIVVTIAIYIIQHN